MAILSDEFYYQSIRIDTINTRVFADIVAKEGDANGRGLLVTLTENGLIKDTTGINLNLKWEHTSVGNQGLDSFEVVDLTKGQYKITYPAEMLNRGKVNAFIQIFDSGKNAGSRNIEIVVDRAVGDDTAIVSSNSFSALVTALLSVNKLDSVYAQVDLLNRGLGATITSLALLNSTYPTGDTKDHIVAGNIAEIDTLTVTSIPTLASTLTITLNGVAKTVAVDPAVQTTTALLATLIRGTAFTGWTTGGTGSVVTFTATATGAKTAPVFAGGTTGVTATFVITVKGENANFHRYFWNGSAWEDGGVYQAIENADNSVGVQHTKFRKRTYNMFDSSKRNIGNGLSLSTGNLTVNANYFTSDYHTYTGANMKFLNSTPSGSYIVEYDSNKAFIKSMSRDEWLAGTKVITIGNPIRTSFPLSSANPDTLMIYFSDDIKPYIPYYIINEEYLPRALSLFDNDLNFMSGDDLLERTHNMFDMNNFNDQKTISTTTGNLSDNVNYYVSDYFEFISNNLKSVTDTAGSYIAEYTPTLTFVKSMTFAEYIAGTKTITIGNKIRASYTRNTALPEEICLYFSDTPLTYAHYYRISSRYQVDTSVSASIVLPAKAEAVVGHEFNIYNDNIVLTDNLDNFEFIWEMSGGLGMHLNECYRLIPTAEDVGVHTLTCHLLQNGNSIATKSCQLHVVADTPVTAKKWVFIGDSLTNNGVYPQEFATMCGVGVTSLGTRTTGSVNHEGRSGWSAHNYVTSGVYKEVVNAFWNPATSAFDFSYYMTQTGYTGLTDVGIMLGTNDVADTQRNLDSINEIIASIHAYDPNINIAVALTIPPCKEQDAFGLYNDENGLGRTKEFKRNQLALVQAYIDNFEDKVNLDVCPLYLNVDAVNDFPYRMVALSSRNPATTRRCDNTVHPDDPGYLKIADVWYYYTIFKG